MISLSEITTEAIVLKNFRGRDSAALITVLTRKKGIINFHVFGYNSKKFLFRSALQPINLINLRLRKDKRGYTLTDAEIRCSYDSIRSDYGKTNTILSIFSSLIRNHIFEGKDFDLIYHLTKKMLGALNSDTFCLKTCSMYFYYQLAWCIGISFSFENPAEGNFCYLQTENGIFFSRKNAVSGNIANSVTKELFNRIKLFSDFKFAELKKLSYITEKEYGEFAELFRRYTQYHLDRPFIITQIPED